MRRDIFHDREQAEEAAYFHQQDAKLIAKLREAAVLHEIAKALAEKLDVDNPELLRRIASLGITLENGGAFLTAPLIRVAWADGEVTNYERDAVIRLVYERGIEPGSSDFTQIDKWLRERPSDAVFDAATEAIRVGLGVLPSQERQERVARVLEACREVAEAAPGLSKALHLKRVSDAEQLVLDDIRAKLTTAPT